MPASAMLRVLSFAPNTIPPFLNHCQPTGASPDAVTLRVTVPPSASIWFVGWVVMAGGETTLTLTEPVTVI